MNPNINNITDGYENSQLENLGFIKTIDINNIVLDIILNKENQKTIVINIG